jgi:regulator of replication initiation timing
MDWEGLRERTLGEVANTLVAEGVGVGAGFIGASTIGVRIEDYMIPRFTAAAPLMTKVKGWAYNNVPKLAIWYMIRKYVPETPETRTQEMLADAKKAIAGSIVFDSLLRATNHGVPLHDPSGYKLLGGKGEEIRTAAAPQADTQRLIQENSALRTELNKALQRLAAPTPTPAQQPIYVQSPAPQAVHVAAPQPVQAAVPPQVTALQADVQRLIQENGAIRSELSNATQRMNAAAQAPQTVHVAAPVSQPVQPVQVHVAAPVSQPAQPVQVQVQAAAPARTAPAPVVRYQPAPAPARAPPVVRVEQQAPVAPPVPATERQKKFAFMPTQNAPPVVRVEQQQLAPQAPAVSERQRRFAFMPTPNAPQVVQDREKKYGFAGKKNEKEIAAMFGML